jgi:hypothetical protein
MAGKVALCKVHGLGRLSFDISNKAAFFGKFWEKLEISATER